MRTTVRLDSEIPFVQKTFAMGSEQLFRCDKALAASDAIEDEELGRKLSPDNDPLP